MELGERLIYFNGNYRSEGEFTTVTHVTPKGYFKIEATGDYSYDPKTLKQRGKKHDKWSMTPYCIKINKDNIKYEERALNSLWKKRIKAVDLDKLNHEQLKAYIGFLNTSGIK